MVELMRSGWPQGEALIKAIAEMEIAWSIPPDAGQAAKSNGNNTQNNGEPNSKRQKHINHDENGKQICKPRNDVRGCSGNGKRCPNGKEHKCDVVKKDGTPCLSKTHNRGGHPRNL